MLTAAQPYASVSLTAHGAWLLHMKALPPLSHPDFVLPPSLSGLSFLSQVRRGAALLPFLGQAQEGLLGTGGLVGEGGCMFCVVFVG